MRASSRSITLTLRPFSSKVLYALAWGDNEGVAAGLTAYLNSADQPALFFSGEAVPDHIAAYKQRGMQSRGRSLTQYFAVS